MVKKIVECTMVVNMFVGIGSYGDENFMFFIRINEP